VRQPGRRSSNAHIDALLKDVSALRLTLDADLTVAAAAAEADRLDVAAEIVNVDRTEVAAFTERATSGLTMAAAEYAVVPQQRALGLRHRLTLAAAPAVLAAATIVAVFGVAHGDNRVQQESASRPQLMATYTAFSELAENNSDPKRLVAIGRQLNISVAALIAQAATDPQMARQALRILEAEQILLSQHHPSGSAGLLEQARSLVRQLQARLPSSVLTVRPVPADPQPPVLTLIVPSSSPTSDPTTSSKPAPTKAPAPSASPTPDAPSDSGTTSPEPSPEPTAIWPFGFAGR
jgi:hypothetical protein